MAEEHDNAWHKVAIGLGGNLGEPMATFDAAVEMLTAAGMRGLRMAKVRITAPVDCVPGTPDFHNTVVVGFWSGTPRELLAVTQGIEVSLGRPREHSSHESRMVDLDILLFDELTLDTAELTIPHPRMFQRAFVLEPLGDLEPEWLETMRLRCVEEDR